jgi:uncharacterized repeat protein (TIGR03803 family)
MITKAISVAVAVLLIGAPLVSFAVSEQVIYTFTGGNDGGNPYGGLVLDGNGNLYGTTTSGGAYCYGTVFQFSPGASGWTETVIHNFNFDGQDGLAPYASLVRDADGNLYGTTNFGGIYNLGTVFELLPSANGWTEKILHNFNADGIDGYYPYANVILDSNGNLYGTATNGGVGLQGIVFELSPNPDGTWQETILLSFDYTHGGLPLGGLVPDSKANLYGTTAVGGDFQHGTVFELKHRPKGKWQELVLHSFDPSSGDGVAPYSVVIDQKNRLYGATQSGIVFELERSKGSWRETIIHSFNNQDDGYSPYGPLAMDSNGRLYGTTFQSYVGGVGGAGIVFQLSPSSQGWQETILHQFVTPGDGGNPYAGVVIDNIGNLFGTTYYGGNFGGTGVVFEVTP